MLCYKDRTFCMDAPICKTTPCYRRLGPSDRAQAEKLNLGVSQASFKDWCEDFVEKEPKK